MSETKLIGENYFFRPVCLFVTKFVRSF